MKFKLDENLGTLGKALLEAAGHDVMTVVEQKLSGEADERIYDVCKVEGRVLVTLDHDFGETLRFPPQDTSGIAIVECNGPLSPVAILARMKDLVTLLETRSVQGELWIVQPGRVRIRAKD